MASGASSAISKLDADAIGADPDRVAQIMRILIDNSLRHAPEGTAIKVGTTTATDTGTASLVVSDDGPGIDPRSRERVFERFRNLPVSA